MKKIAVLALALAGLFSQAGALASKDQAPPTSKEFKISMDRDGAIKEVMWKGNTLYSKPTPENKDSPDLILGLSAVRFAAGIAFPKELPVGTKVTITIAGFQNKDKFKISITPQKTKYDLVPIFTGETKPAYKAVQVTEAELVSSFILDESGTTYAIKITRSESGSNSPGDIFAESLQTRTRYRFGSHVGVFVPFGRSAEYRLGYATPADADPTVMESKRRNVNMIFIGSFYPFNFEPDGECFSYRRIQVNLATELSSSIFKKIYFGLGYDFTYVSISLLGRFATVQELQSGFKTGNLVTGGLTSAPTVPKNKLDWGLTICMPVDLMIAWLGRSLGLK